MRILITGPECSGKSTLARDLSKAIQCAIIPELARPYLTLSHGDYTLSDLNCLADQQWAIEQLYRPLKPRTLVFDTGALVLEIWAAQKFKEELVRPTMLNERYDIIVLCQPDMPWEYDALRANPEDRERLARIYEEKLSESSVPWISVSGPPDTRLSQALQFYQENKL